MKEKLRAEFRLHTAVDGKTYEKIKAYCKRSNMDVSTLLRIGINGFVQIPKELLSLRRGPKHRF